MGAAVRRADVDSVRVAAATKLPGANEETSAEGEVAGDGRKEYGKTEANFAK